jgi:hypothetical protein
MLYPISNESHSGFAFTEKKENISKYNPPNYFDIFFLIETNMKYLIAMDKTLIFADIQKPELND